MRKKPAWRYAGCKTLQEVVSKAGIDPVGSSSAVEFVVDDKHDNAKLSDAVIVAGLTRKLQAKNKTISNLRARIKELEKIIDDYYL